MELKFIPQAVSHWTFSSKLAGLYFVFLLIDGDDNVRGGSIGARPGSVRLPPQGSHAIATQLLGLSSEPSNIWRYLPCPYERCKNSRPTPTGPCTCDRAAPLPPMPPSNSATTVGYRLPLHSKWKFCYHPAKKLPSARLSASRNPSTVESSRASRRRL